MTLLIKNMNMKRGKKRVIRQLNLLWLYNKLD